MLNNFFPITGRIRLAAAAAAVLLPAALPTPATAQATPITLSEAIARGRANGVQGALARLSAKAVSARTSERRSDLLPNVSGTASVVRQTLNLTEFGLSFPGAPEVTDPFTVYRFRLTGEQLLFSKSTLDRLGAARDTAIAAGLDAARVGDISAAAAGAAWLRLAGADETVQAREADSVTAVALLDIARAQVDAGTAPRIDRTRSETQLAAARIRLAVARNERDRATLDLARAIDLPVATPIVLSGDPTIPLGAMPANIDSAVALARAQRQDLAAERQRVTVMQKSLNAITDELFPSLGLSAGLGTSGRGLDRLGGTWNIGVGLSWPLFDGFRRGRRADEQRIRIDAQQLRLHDLESQVEAEARQAALDIASARGQVVVAEEGLRLAEQELQEARERFTAGVTGSVETTNAQADVTSARDALIQARVAAGAAQVSAAKALGLLDQVH
ncbi:MAG: TolC family protein [Gemmatimonadota bacterium]